MFYFLEKMRDYARSAPEIKQDVTEESQTDMACKQAQGRETNNNDDLM
jgi:hypothetical protein